jgi:hypothetical protein
MSPVRPTEVALPTRIQLSLHIASSTVSRQYSYPDAPVLDARVNVGEVDTYEAPWYRAIVAKPCVSSTVVSAAGSLTRGFVIRTSDGSTSATVRIAPPRLALPPVATTRSANATWRTWRR